MTPVGTELVDEPCLPWRLQEGGGCHTDPTGEASFSMSQSCSSLWRMDIQVDIQAEEKYSKMTPGLGHSMPWVRCLGKAGVEGPGSGP